MEIWKRNVAMATIVLLVCVAVYLSWSYRSEETADADKTLGKATLVSSQTNDPLVGGTAASPGPASSASPEAGTTGGGSHLDSVRLSRQQARDSTLTILQDSITNESANETMKETSGETIQTLASCTVSEMQVENLMTAEGYTDCMVFIGDESVSMVVSTQEGDLTDADVAGIAEVVTDETGMKTSQVKIIETRGQVVLERAVKNQL